MKPREHVNKTKDLRFPNFYHSSLLPLPRFTAFTLADAIKKWGVGKVQGAGAGWTGGKVRSPECRVRRAARQLTTSLVS